LRPCSYAPDAYRGTVARALDPTGAVPETIDISTSREPLAQATIGGQISGRKIAAAMYAP
jgi:hypothetical protein